ncbi:DNA mismatch repair protein C-terminal [Penicillium taxi]|uniref:DNA mismatch repair protein C-terminal n=1 Tax=Penicillium taxi TaxID=168475 RepID=UPI0025455E0E|nr:DNA mismatch repair protein C-terminal [Penicillium taxi]KAJ5900010.1 DNA mismatch repair protein C-terminal [Penicillium taxi]
MGSSIGFVSSHGLYFLEGATGMPITPLLPETVRAIGSTSVISDACSVVKELIDNAIDASASTLVIQIAQNTLDVIQLKDNGHGISTEDYPHVCTHMFTSKIQTLEDLKNVGGTSLGFRGEALSSIAEMSESVIVTTCIAADATASCLHYRRDGKISLSQRVSHPVGTTVRIENFLKHIPVRKQTALKSAPKTLTRVKKLLQAYAIAQPSKGFFLKVVKAKNEIQNWIYAPSPNATLLDAVIKIVGREVASFCVFKQLSSDGFLDRNGSLEQTQFQIGSLLPLPEADMSQVNNTGQFVSIDGRPLNVSRGIGYDIVKLFKSHLRSNSRKTGSSKSMIDPFFCLQISCPLGTYDVNIEPGKDDVLFEDRELVLSLVERLLSDHYGPLQEKTQSKLNETAAQIPHDQNGFEILMARKKTDVLGNRPEKGGDLSIQSTPASTTQGRSPFHALISPESTPGSLSQTVIHIARQTPINRGPRHANPWSVSRVNASFQAPRSEIASQIGSTKELPYNSPPSSRRNNMQRRVEPDSPPGPDPPSPPASRSPISRRHPQDFQNSSPQAKATTSSARQATRERDKERYGNGALDTWFLRTRDVPLGEQQLNPASGQDEYISSISRPAQERFGSPPRNLAPDSMEMVGVHSPTNNVMSGEVPPEHPQLEENGASSNNKVHTAVMDSSQGFPVLEKWAASLRDSFNAETPSDLERAADSGKSPQSNGKSRHHNRYLAAKASLASDRSFVIESPTPLPPQDPRAYLLRNPTETSKAGSKPSRLHRSRLPFERIPEGYDIHDVSISLPAEITRIKEYSIILGHCDFHTDFGEEIESLSPPNMDTIIPFWNDRLASIMKNQYGNQDEVQSELKIDLSSILAKHMR